MNSGKELGVCKNCNISTPLDFQSAVQTDHGQGDETVISCAVVQY